MDTTEKEYLVKYTYATIDNSHPVLSSIVTAKNAKEAVKKVLDKERPLGAYLVDIKLIQ